MLTILAALVAAGLWFLFGGVDEDWTDIAYESGREVSAEPPGTYLEIADPGSVPDLNAPEDTVRATVAAAGDGPRLHPSVKPKSIDDEAMQTLVACDWPGNVKELNNIVERMVISVPISQISFKDIPPSIRGSAGLQAEGSRTQAYEMWDSYEETIEFLEKDYLLHHLKKHSSDMKATAKSLKLTPRRLARRIDKFGLQPQEARTEEPPRQKTLKRSVVLAGQGLHSGTKTGLILTPLPPNSGILFGNISTGESVPAHIDYVESTDFATSLRKGTTCAKTTEHFLAVLHSYRISNLLVKINDELPIMDGSATDFCTIVEDAGAEEQEAPLEEIVIDEKYVIGQEGEDSKFLRIEPAWLVGHGGPPALSIHPGTGFGETQKHDSIRARVIATKMVPKSSHRQPGGSPSK